MQYWRSRAEEMRVVAEDMLHPEIGRPRCASQTIMIEWHSVTSNAQNTIKWRVRQTQVPIVLLSGDRSAQPYGSPTRRGCGCLGIRPRLRTKPRLFLQIVGRFQARSETRSKENSHCVRPQLSGGAKLEQVSRKMANTISRAIVCPELQSHAGRSCAPS